MSSPRLHLRGPQSARLNPYYQMPLGQVLVEHGVIDNDILLNALGMSEHLGAALEHVLLAEGWATHTDILRAQSDRFAAIPVGFEETPPDPACSIVLDAAFCLEHHVWPWTRLGQTLVLATSKPDQFEDVIAKLPDDIGTVLMGIATPYDIETAIAQAHGRDIALQAERDVPADKSCRDMFLFASRRQTLIASFFAVLLGVAILAMPELFLLFMSAWAVFTMAAITAMKSIALAARVFFSNRQERPLQDKLSPTPMVTLLVPLFREKDIAGSLVKRLSKLTYPKSRLEALLVLEAEDIQTRELLAQSELPSWMRVLTVPPGSLKTKPRAMNYARRFAKGEIIGVYDAEDAPAPDQIEAIVDHFRRAPDDVGCVQGVLDYYNPRANWLARCFTIEYAAWFRMVLPGLSRIGMPIPLGGTTVFFRADVLDEMEGWDAHNVTEDADLGMRLARAGYRTELVNTVTMEEANCRLWPWIRQRSRWLKGYLITYLVHMRRPLTLLRELGFRQFLGFQILFVASLSQFAFAPLLWTFWLVLADLPHPVLSHMSDTAFTALTLAFLSSEIVGFTVGVTAVASAQHRHLIPWVPTLMFYFPFGVLAIYKAIFETIFRPFFWDKTSHGHSEGQKKTSTIETGGLRRRIAKCAKPWSIPRYATL